MKKLTCLAVTTFLAGCVHTTPNPVQLSQIGDETKSCRALENEMQEMQNTVGTADSDKNGQVGKNVALGVTGAFLLVPLFFMDTSDAHSVEAKAALQRRKRLQAIYEDKNCIPPGQKQTPAAATSSNSSPVVPTSVPTPTVSQP